MSNTLPRLQRCSSAQRYSYTSVRLERVLWRGPGQLLVEYRAVDDILPLIGPGQFILFWVSGLEAIPLSPIYSDEEAMVLLVRERGETTRSVVRDPPRYAGVIAPLGQVARVPSEKEIVVLAGGVGIASAAPLAREAARRAKRVVLVYGAKTSRELAPVEEYLGGVDEVLYVTEDGSKGARGTVIDALEYLELGDALVYAAGPNPMLCALYRWAEERSLLARVHVAPERIVRCGMGFCGRCALPGTRLLLCRDGAYIAASVLREWVDKGCPVD